MSTPKRPHPEHPRERSPEPDDPMSLGAQGVPGDTELMLDCLIEEYARMGWPAEKILLLFDRPFFQATHGLNELYGATAIRQRIDSVIARCGVLRFETHEHRMEEIDA